MHWPVFADYDEKLVQCLAMNSKDFNRDIAALGYRWFNNNPDQAYNAPGPYGGKQASNGWGEDGTWYYGHWRWGN